MKLFYISCEDENGDSADGFVIAEDDLSALDLWKTADYAINATYGLADVFLVVPAKVEGPARLLDWHQPDGVIEV